MSKYGDGANITGSLIVDGEADLGSGDDNIDIDAGTLFVDASDNRVGIKTESPAYELHVAGDMGVNEYIYHNDDTDTFIRFETDQITAKAGNVSFINITEDDSQDKISFNEGRADVDFIVRSPDEALAVYLNADNEVFHINHGESAFKTKIHSTNGEAITINNDGVILNEDGAAANDFRIETSGEDEALFVDAGSNTLYVNKGATGFTTVIKNNNEEVIRVGAAGLIINEYGHASNDVRIESDNDTHMLFVDAGNDVIGIGTNSPICKLDVAGKIAISAEVSTPTAPSDGEGWLYTKTDGKIYWQSYDVSETDLTSGGGAGGGISWDGSTANGVATFKDSDEATVESNLTFDGSTLTVTGDVEVNGTIHTPIDSLTLADTIDTDASTGNIFTVTLTGSNLVTLANPTNLEDGAAYSWIIKQDDDGGNDLLFGTNFKFINGLPPGMLSASHGVNILEGISDGTFVYLTSNMAVTGTAVSGSDASKKDDGAYLFDDFRRRAKLSYWYDATEEDTITKDGSNLVSGWEDKGSTGANATQTNGTEKPTYNATALNGFPGITFNGSDNMMYLGGIGDEEEMEELNVSYFMVGKFDDTVSGHIIGHGSSSPGYLLTYGVGLYASSGKPGVKSTNNGSDTVITSTSTVTDDEPVLIRGIIKPNDSSLYVNGIVKGTNTGVPKSYTGYNVASMGASDGSNADSPEDYWAGTIGEIIIFTGAPLSGMQIRGIEKYLIIKWDLVGEYRS